MTFFAAMFDEEQMVSVVSKLHQGEAVEILEYDPNTYSHKQTVLVIKPTKIILFSGILLLWFPALRDLFDMKVFVDLDADTRLTNRGNMMV